MNWNREPAEAKGGQRPSGEMEPVRGCSPSTYPTLMPLLGEHLQHSTLDLTLGRHHEVQSSPFERRSGRWTDRTQLGAYF